MELNIKEWGLTKKIISGVILLVVLWIIWTIFFGVNQNTQTILNLPEGSLKIVNSDGEEIDITIRISNASTSFSGVDSKVIKENVIYYTSTFPASAKRKFKQVSIPIEIARFDKDGKIKEIHEIPAKMEVTIDPESDYQHTLIAEKGFFEKNNISVENGSTIQ